MKIDEAGVEMKRRDKKFTAQGFQYLPRKSVGEYTNGLYSPRTMANLDCQGRGPRGRVLVGGQVCYPVDELLAWIEARTQKI